MSSIAVVYELREGVGDSLPVVDTLALAVEPGGEPTCFSVGVTMKLRVRFEFPLTSSRIAISTGVGVVAVDEGKEAVSSGTRKLVNLGLPEDEVEVDVERGGAPWLDTEEDVVAVFVGESETGEVDAFS